MCNTEPRVVSANAFEYDLVLYRSFVSVPSRGSSHLITDKRNGYMGCALFRAAPELVGGVYPFVVVVGWTPYPARSRVSDHEGELAT